MTSPASTLLTITLCSLMVACGGSSGSEPSSKQTPVPPTSVPFLPNTTPTASPPPQLPPSSQAQFSAEVTIAPQHRSTFSSIVRLEVRGNGMENVELLPPTGYEPKFAVFNISQDKTFAWLDWDISVYPKCVLFSARISAFDKPAGSHDAREIIAMTTRTWYLNPENCTAYNSSY